MIIHNVEFWQYLKKRGYTSIHQIFDDLRDEKFMASKEGQALLKSFESSFTTYMAYLEEPTEYKVTKELKDD